MKIVKRYLAFALVLAIALIGKFYTLNIDNSTLDDFRGGTLAASTWNVLVARDVNGQVLSVSIDNKEYTNTSYDVYMDDDRNIMVPVSILRDALNCSAHVYDGQTLLVEKHSLVLSFTLESDVVTVNGEEIAMDCPLTQKGETLYISLNALSSLLEYSSSFDINLNAYAAADTSDSTSVVPSYYDLRDRDRLSSIRNQGAYGTCWAFAALSAMESSLLPEDSESFAVDHMVLANSFDMNLYDGGDYTMGMAYLAAWQGPVYERDDPYGDGATVGGLSPAYHVQEMRIIDGKDYEAIKTAVFKYGGVQSSIYSTIASSADVSSYYNATNYAYCYIGTEKPNHDVVIIGWDDNYPKENFTMDLEGDGAFICQNSWGSRFGDGGVFYVSYYDTNIGTHNVVYTSIEPTDNYDNIYQSDLCGWVGKLGYDNESIFGANVFTAEGDENVVAASFYATGANSTYELYVVSDFKNTDSFGGGVKVAGGTLDQAGYYTIDFDQPVAVTKGEKYAVVLYISTPGATHPLAIEYQSDDDALSVVDLEDGEGYISYNGKKFINVKEKQDCNLCIKAFTNDR